MAKNQRQWPLGERTSGAAARPLQESRIPPIDEETAMRYMVTGGSGFVGTHLIQHLLASGHQVAATGTARTHPSLRDGRLQWYSVDTTDPGQWQEAVADADVVINLAGRTIMKRWTHRYKRQIVDSRIKTTRRVVAALPEDRPTVLVSTSAVGYYGPAGEAVLNEKSPAGSDFLARLAVDWEAEATAAQAKGTRVAIARLGVVLGAGGGALAQMLPAFRSFVGGPIGSGRQWFPWIHMTDVLRAMTLLAETPSMTGAYNFCAPEPVRNQTLARQLGWALGRPSFFKTPAAALRIALGEVAGTLTASQRVLPDRLTEAGFQFRYPDLAVALKDLVA
jgi:uncharacterized protein (TIGR01777 family)